MNDITEIFSELSFDRKTMRERLSKEVYEVLNRNIESGSHIDREIAAEVAEAMKNWAIEKGAVYFTHWFQPITGFAAEKHNTFASPSADGGIIMRLSGEELVKKETQVPVLTSAGRRDTFEMRGYAAWDTSSYAFILGETLYIPTSVCLPNGTALDKKTPLLRSMKALNEQALRILRLFGEKNVNRVIPIVGAEQEYFLVNKDLAVKRNDLAVTGRTLFGEEPPKGQKNSINEAWGIAKAAGEFMQELDRESLRLGIPVKTGHNEAAPCQYELAVGFTTANLAADQNRIVMKLMGRLADKYGFVCLLHEKPFDGINGSAKHNNWSLFTDDGTNLFEPGRTPRDNARFLMFLCAVIAAVDEHQDLLRISTASAGNDCRLGGAEAPSTVISVFLGDELTSILNALADEMPYNMEIAEEFSVGTDTLPELPVNTTDRNRTSPIAFTGSKFEFRTVGSNMPITEPNIVINTIVADKLAEFADMLEKAEDFDKSAEALIKQTLKQHRRIIFNGNNYSYEWLEEARRRGLLNLSSTPDAMVYLTSEANIRMFKKHGVYSEEEIRSKCEILYDEYCDTVCVEAGTMSRMLRHEILPAICKFSKLIAETALAKKNAFSSVSCEYELMMSNEISSIEYRLYKKTEILEGALARVKSGGLPSERAAMCRDYIIPAMREARALADKTETMLPAEFIPFPTYSELLF